MCGPCRVAVPRASRPAPPPQRGSKLCKCAGPPWSFDWGMITRLSGSCGTNMCQTTQPVTPDTCWHRLLRGGGGGSGAANHSPDPQSQAVNLPPPQHVLGASLTLGSLGRGAVFPQVQRVPPKQGWIYEYFKGGPGRNSSRGVQGASKRQVRGNFHTDKQKRTWRVTPYPPPPVDPPLPCVVVEWPLVVLLDQVTWRWQGGARFGCRG